jgi:hypothetical protein
MSGLNRFSDWQVAKMLNLYKLCPPQILTKKTVQTGQEIIESLSDNSAQTDCLCLPAAAVFAQNV